MRQTNILKLFLLALCTVFVVPATANAAIDSTRDCDSVAIIRCGVMSESELQQKSGQGDVRKVYQAFGITRSELNGFANGIVYADGRVTVGDKVVARNAITAGRWDSPKAGMTRIAGTDKAYKMSPQYFEDEGQTAFVKMTNGRFDFAIIKSCGNPVTATPVEPEKPDFIVTKDVRAGASGGWMDEVRVKPGDTVQYRVVITNTGKTPLNDMGFDEVLPQGLRQDIGETTLNGGRITNDLSDGMRMPGLDPGKKHILIYQMRVETDAESCQKGLVNTVKISPDGLQPKSDTARIKVCKPVTTAVVTDTEVPPVVTEAVSDEQPVKSVPETLVDTGPGAIIGAISSFVVSGSLAYKFVWLRRFA